METLNGINDVLNYLESMKSLSEWIEDGIKLELLFGLSLFIFV